MISSGPTYAPVFANVENRVSVQKGSWQKVAPFFIFLPTVVSLLIGVLYLCDYRSTGLLYKLPNAHRTTVQFIVHMVASAFGCIWSYCVCATVNLYTRQLLPGKDTCIDTLRFWSGISGARVDLNLRDHRVLLLALFLGLTSLPSSLWSGALTPVATTQTIKNHMLSVPKTGNGSYNFLHFYQQRTDDGCWIPGRVQPNGSFTNCPTLEFASSLLLSASSATTADGSPRLHSKFDKSGYNFQGRSYGVGAAAGLTDTNYHQMHNYTYTEIGYLTSVKCIYNSSSQWGLRLHHSELWRTWPSIFAAVGFLPNSNWTEISAHTKAYDNDIGDDGLTSNERQYGVFYAQVGLDNGASIVSIGSRHWHETNLTEYIIAIASGSDYTRLDKLQCQFFFTPTIFSIEVSRIYNTIKVTPAESTTTDPDPSGFLRSHVLRNINALTVHGTSLYTSTTGDSLMGNVANMLMQQASSLNTTTASNETILAAVADSMEAMADDILIALGSAALTEPGSWMQTPIEAVRPAIKIGSKFFIIAIVSINIAALLFIAGFTVASRFWKNLPAFDYTDLGCMAVGVALGKTAMESASEDDSTNPLNRLEGWDGQPSNELVGRLKTRLEEDGGRVSVALY